MNSACRELGGPHPIMGLQASLQAVALEKGLYDMLKDFQESLCQSREPLSTLRAFLLSLPLVEKGPSPVQHKKNILTHPTWVDTPW